MFVFGDHLLAEEAKEELKLLYLVGDGSSAPVNGSTEDEESDRVGHKRAIQVVVVLCYQDLKDSFHYIIGSVEELRHSVVV